jgi:membrane associated rhomboid family serine protease
MMKNWSDSTRFPEAHGEWQIFTNNEVMSVGEEDVRKLALRWFLTQKKLVSTPESSRFLPAICVPGLADFTHQSFLSRFKIYFYLIGFYLLLTIIVAFLTSDFDAYTRIMAMLITALIYVFVEFQIAFKPYPNIYERTLFYNWIFQQRNPTLEFAILIVVAAGAAQWLYQQQSGNLESLVMGYGTYFPAIESGQLWRYVTGPFIHSSFIHWLVNAVFLLYITKLIGKLATTRILTLFLISIPITAAIVHLVNLVLSNILDGLVGVSGGIYFLFGWLTAIAYLHRGFFPANYYLSILLVAACNLVLPEILNYNSSFTAHISGFLLGIIAGSLGLASNLRQLDQTTGH